MNERRPYIEVIGAKQNNLKNVSVDIPHNKLTVITGVSGSGKSSLAFDVIYGEAQRRFMKSLSNAAKSRMGQIKKPNVDYVRGLSPVIAIDQKRGNHNPRSTIGTITDINDYLRLLYATSGTGKCPECGYVLEQVSASRLAESISTLPPGTSVKIYVAVKKLYGENYDFLFKRIRKWGYSKLFLDGQPYDLTEMPFEPDEQKDYHMEVLLETVTANSELSLQTAKAIDAAISGLEDDLLLRLEISGGHTLRHIGCAKHNYVLCELKPLHFSFNVAEGACETCMGIGTSYVAEPRFIVKKPQKSINKGALHPRVFDPHSPQQYPAVFIYSAAQRYGFSLDTPFEEYPEDVRNLLFYGNDGERIEMLNPPHFPKTHWLVGSMRAFRGIVKDLESEHRNANRQLDSGDRAHVSNITKDVMVEKICPVCDGMRLKKSRLAITLGDKNIGELCRLPFSEVIAFLEALEAAPHNKDAVDSIIKEISSRLQLLVDVGLHYLSLGRRSDSISGGELQRIKMSTQISSELWGILYVMDEPSIGLHPRDSGKIIDIMKKLRDIGNTVIVVEHDVETMQAADYLVEVGPSAGIHGGRVIACGPPETFIANENCLSGAYMTGKRNIPVPKARRKPTRYITLQGAKENNLKNVTVDIPLGVFVCVTGVSGSGKSTLIFETLSKHLEVQKRGALIIPGELDFISGYENISNVITIDQSPIGRNSKSSPATYVGVYDRMRALFASMPDAVKKGYQNIDFSLTNANGTRCEHCAGDGILVTNLQFMADIETVCPICKGSRFSPDGLEIRYNGKNIAEVLDMTVEEALDFFAHEKLIQHKLKIMYELGLGYLTLGQSAPTLSGGEAQRVKLSYELGKIKRGSHNLYILDEPTTGLHCADIENLLSSIQRLVEQGHSVIVVEHNLDVIKCADYIIDMGPEGGKDGGFVIAAGTPEDVAAIPGSFTGQFLKKVFKVRQNHFPTPQ